MSETTDVPARPRWLRAAEGTASAERVREEAGAATDPDAAVDHSSPREGGWATLWLADRDIKVFAVLAAAVLSLLLVRWYQVSGGGMREVVIERLEPLEFTFRLDLNTATWVELAQLDGVGESLALRIVERRDRHGPYVSVDELDEVKGVGPKTLKRLRSYVRVAAPEPATPAQR